jgi:hypothetical protein
MNEIFASLSMDFRFEAGRTVFPLIPSDRSSSIRLSPAQIRSGRSFGGDHPTCSQFLPLMIREMML